MDAERDSASTVQSMVRSMARRSSGLCAAPAIRSARRIARTIWRRFEPWLIPAACVHCGRLRAGLLPLCRPCLRTMRRAVYEEDEAVAGLPWVRALFRLTPPLHAMVHAFKYRQERRHIAFICAWLRWRPAWRADFAEAYDAIVPVPLHPARRRARGHNQAEGIARAVSAAAAPTATAAGGGDGRELPVRETLLIRLRDTGTQTRLGGRGRGGNLDGAFRASSAVQGLRLLLVDDVCTTGSTLAHCRDALLAAGALRVDALVLARVELGGGADPLPDFETAAGFFA